ncbi:MAG: 30S ribosome-binding factor RbfA [Clostridia bacterium]|nr:30S ribosome-binding factor RbfA [Clostridia bacterium]
MAKYRAGRINDEMQKTVAAAMREVKDPRVSGAFVSITGAEVTPDLKYAKIFYSSLMGDKKEVAKGLKSSAGFIRGYVAKNMNLRITPELTFIEDKSIENGNHISALLHKIETGEK